MISKILGLICLLLAFSFLSISVQFVFAQEKPVSTSSPNQNQTTSATPVPAPAKSYSPNPDSYNQSPFSDLTTGEVPPPTPKNTPKPTSSSTPKPQTSPKPTVTSVPPPVVPRPSATPVGIGATLFDFKGVLWNGYEYVGIIISKTNAKHTFIAKSGDKLEEGYWVLNVSDKKTILVKDGVQSTLFLSEVK